MLLGDITFQNVKYNLSCKITVDKPKEPKEIANIGDDQGQSDDLDDEPDVDHGRYFVLVEGLILREMGLVINYPF